MGGNDLNDSTLERPLLLGRSAQSPDRYSPSMMDKIYNRPLATDTCPNHGRVIVFFGKTLLKLGSRYLATF